jgi:drug/metabolite transporter (DMT)-like permease
LTPIVCFAIVPQLLAYPDLSHQVGAVLCRAGLTAGFKTDMPTFSIAKPSALAGPLFMLLSACWFTVMNLLLKQATADFGVWDIGFYRFCGGLIILGAVFGRNANPFRSGNRKLLLIRGCTGSVAFILFIFSVQRLPVSTALMLLYAYPAFAALFSLCLFKEKASAIAWLCMAGVLSGVAILVDPAGGVDLFGAGAAVFSAVVAGLTIAIIRRLKQTHGSVIIYLFFCLIGSMVTAPAFLYSPAVPINFPQAMTCGGIALFSALGHLTMNHGFGYCRSWEGGLYLASEVVFTSLAGIALFGDPVGWRFFIGGALILGSAVAIQADRALRGKNFTADLNVRAGK